MPAPDVSPNPAAASRLVLGTWGLSGAVPSADGPAGYSDPPSGCFDEVLDLAYQSGVRWIDTAPGYGNGKGLALLASWQRRRNVALQVIMKPGRPTGADGPYSDLRPSELLRTVDEGIDMVGFPEAILVKDPSAEAFHDGRLEKALTEIVNAWPGIRVGLTMHQPELVRHLPRLDVPAPIVQLEYHAINRVLSVPAAKQASDAGWDVWGMQPLAYGFLGGRHPHGPAFAADDWRSRIPATVRHALMAAASAYVSSLPSSLRGRPPAESALAWCMAAPALARVVVGPRTAAQFRSVLDALYLASLPEFAQFVAGRCSPHSK